MPYKCKIVFSLFFLSLSFKGFSSFTIRPYSEIGVFGGTSYYLGELNHAHFPLTLLKPAGGIFYRYNLNGHYSFRFFANYTEVNAADSYSNNVFERNRGLSFKSAIVEVGSTMEFNFYEFALYKDAKRKITPFIFGGLNYFYFNPQGNLGGTWVDLQPLGTEGQGAISGKNKYFLHQLAIPMGLGVKVKIQRFAITAEWGIRKTFTDYMDDVSTTYADPKLLTAEAAQFANKSNLSSESLINKQRGDSKSKDWYVFTGVTVSFKLGKEAICRDSN